MIYSASESPSDYEVIENMPLDQVILRLCFKRFTGWIEEQLYEEAKNG